MIFNSTEFMIFFPIVVAVYYVIPQKVRYIWLLVTSCYFYMNWNPKYIILLLACTGITYCTGIILENIKDKKEEKTRRKICFCIALIIPLLILAFFKYFDFGLFNLNRVLGLLHIENIEFPYSIVLPVGISFYTLQSLGYLIDVYRGDIYAEKNFLRYALFISFFPQLVAGPIERSKNLLVQLYKPKQLKWEFLKKGVLLMLWGLFLKLVIADRAAIFVNAVYENCSQYQGFYIVIATVLFAMQIYCDFYGYSIIAKGAALILGIELMSNFEAPYFSRSIKEFWRRWHISLSGWFRDYLYIPLGGNRKGWIRKQANLFTVFTISGLWHGASIAFIVWGMLHGSYQIIGDTWVKVKRSIGVKVSEKQDSFSSRLRQRIITFILVCIAWIFFRAGGVSAAIDIIKNMFCFNWMVMFDGSLYQLGVSEGNFIVMLLSILLLGFIDYKKYEGNDMVQILMKQEWWFKLIVYIGLLFAILLFGCYGVEYDTSEFIYFQF